MDYWAENQGHLPQSSKFNTLPSRSYAQNYHDRQPLPQYQAYCEEQRGKAIDSGYCWPSKDATHWSNQESTAPTSPLQFPFNLDHRIQHYQGEQRHELQDWATFQHQERGFQHEGWTYNPVHYKRELSKRNENNFRELEAWALRYSHSLPRRRRIEAELRGAMQDNVERREMQMANVQESALRERASRQQAINYYQTVPQTQNLDVKDKISYQTKLYSHPPNYNAPPSYSVQYRNVPTQQTSAKQSHELPQVVKKTEKELYEKYPAKVEAKGLDILQGRQLVRRSSSNATKIIEGRKFQLNKKAGGLTIFCLVSRIADAEPENAPISPKQNEAAHPKASEVSPASKQADEVDSKSQTSTKHARSPYSKLQAIPICKESLSKIVDKNVQKSSGVSAIGKLAAKFPLWRRPSFTSSVDSDNAPTTCSKEILESNLEDQEKDSKSAGNIDVESQKSASKNDDATLTIDTTCVVVKMELLEAPKKEQVHYLSSEDQDTTEQKLANECNEDISTEKQDTGQVVETLAEQANGEDVVEGTKSEDALPTNSETLEERTKKICGLRESTAALLQREDNVDFAVEDLTKQNKDTHQPKSGEMDQKELINILSISKDENVQLLQETSCENEEIKTNTEIGNVGEPKENIMEESGTDFQVANETQELKMAESLEQVSDIEVGGGQCQEPVEMSDSIDISNSLDPHESSNLQQHLEDVASKPPESEVDEDAEDFTKREKVATEPILTAAKVEELSENIVHSHDQNVSEGSSDLVEKIETCNIGELNWPVSIDNDNDITLSRLEKHEESIAQAVAITNSQQLDSGQKEEAPTLENSENEQNQCVKLTEAAAVELFGGDVDKLESVSISCVKEVDGDDNIEVVTGGIETITEINESVAVVDAFTDKEQLDPKEKEQEHISVASNEKDFEQEIEKDLMEQFESSDKACANEEGLITNVQDPVSSTDVQDNQEIEPATLTEPQVEILSEEQNTEKGGENVNKVDIIKLLNGQIDEGCSVDVKAADANLSDLEKQKTLNGNIESGQEECANETITSEVEVDHTEVTHEEAAVKDIIVFDLQDEEESDEMIVGATCAKLCSETADILVEDGEPVNEPETPKDMDSKEKIVEEIGKIDESDENINATEMQQCEWEDDILDCNVTEDGLNVKNTEKSDSEICQSTKSEDVLQPEVHPCDKNITDSTVNTGVAILERSNASMDGSEQSHPSTCENVCCEEEGKYPKSLWDAVNRIRKHTAPDSENEEEEIMDNWDRESLVSVENVFDNAVPLDFMQTEQCYEDLNVQDDAFSQCSNNSQESDGTIVDDDLEETEMTNVESVDEDQSSDGEGKGQNAAQNEDTMNQKKIEEFPKEKWEKDAEMAEDIML